MNSLYPTCMTSRAIPVGKPIAFERGRVIYLIPHWNTRVRFQNDKPFYFLYCNITSPKYLEHPFFKEELKLKMELEQ